MSRRLWDRLSSDYRENCLSWKHSPVPLIPGDAWWRERWTANPDVLELAGRRLLYYRGNGRSATGEGDHHDRIGVAEVLIDGAESTAPRIRWRRLAGDEPVVDIGPGGSFDDTHALDPAAVRFGGRVLLYYSAVGAGPDAIGLATSTDGITFTKYGRVLDGRAPEVVESDGRLHLLHQVRVDDGYELHLRVSTDGITFPDDGDGGCVFRGEPGSWDAQSVVTVRIHRDGDTFFMLYGGSANSLDEPEFFGLARSSDLRTWERHPGNPIFGHGAGGTIDGGAIWFPALIETAGHAMLLYEGSRGKYAWDLSSQICVASLRFRQR
jgi:hypothetical protein